MIANFMSVKDDPYNELKLRNIKNTNPYEYNCGGYALGIMNWYIPIYAYNYDFDNEETAINKTKELVARMLEEIDGLRVINDIAELDKDEYAVAFRFTSDWLQEDFHFIKRARNGQWYEKMGSSSYINRVPTKKVFAPEWTYSNAISEIVYDSPLVLFAKKF